MTDNPKYTAEQTAVNRKKWTDALRSGEFEQGRHVLVNLSDEAKPTYCCLGVACELAAREGVIPPRVGRQYADEYLKLPEVVREWLGIEGDEGGLKGLSGTPDTATCLSSLNDNYFYDFNQLADVIDNGGVRLTEDL